MACIRQMRTFGASGLGQTFRNEKVISSKFGNNKSDCLVFVRPALGVENKNLILDVRVLLCIDVTGLPMNNNSENKSNLCRKPKSCLLVALVNIIFVALPAENLPHTHTKRKHTDHF